MFDPNTIADRATYAKPHQLAVGVEDVLVNGGFAFKDGKATGAATGRFVHGRAWLGAPGRRMPCRTLRLVLEQMNYGFARAPAGKRRLRNAEPFSPKRLRASRALLMPIRGPDTVSTTPRRR